MNRLLFIHNFNSINKIFNRSNDFNVYINNIYVKNIEPYMNLSYSSQRPHRISYTFSINTSNSKFPGSITTKPFKLNPVIKVC